MAIAHQETRKWGEGELTIGFDTDGRWLVANFEAKGKKYGPMRLYDLPEPYLDPAKMKYVVGSTFTDFAAEYGGENHFTKVFGSEAGELAYGAHRRKIEAARKVIDRPAALNIAKDLLRAFYIENPPSSGKSPFENFAMVNHLNRMTYGNFSYEEVIEILKEAVKELQERPSMGAAGGKPVTVGGRELVQVGYRDVYEVKLKLKGPGLWYEALAPRQPRGGPREWTPRKGEKVLVLRQGAGIWHVFYQNESTSSGGDPIQALEGGLGDAIGTDREMKRYCDLVLTAPKRLAEEYDGLYRAQSQCYHDRQGG